MKIAAALLLCVAACAQDAQFDAQSRLVMVPALVTDAKGQCVDGLDASDFIVLDNGRPRKAIVDSIATGVAPIALVVAVQSAGISTPALAKVRKIGSMIEPLIIGQRGRAALVSFSEEVRWLQELTKDENALGRAFAELRPQGENTARMRDAAHEAILRLRAVPNVRRVLLLISESRDRGSETDLDVIVKAAESAGVTVYAATYSAYATAFTAKPSDTAKPKGGGPDLIGAMIELSRRGKINDAEVLTTRTGGAIFSFARQKGLEDAIAKLGSELHSQYVLSFTPEAVEPGFHRIEVRLTRAGEYRLRARPGYWSVAAAE